MLYGRHPALPPILYLLVKESQECTQYIYLKELVKTLIDIQIKAYSLIPEIKKRNYNNAQ